MVQKSNACHVTKNDNLNKQFAKFWKIKKIFVKFEQRQNYYLISQKMRK